MMARPKSNGPYAPLSATYYYDDAILEAGEKAEILFVRTLAFLSSAASDGYVTERQLVKVIGAGLTRVPDRVRALCSVGLISATPGGYVVRSWSKWNKTTEEIGKYLKRDRERKANVSAAKQDNSARNPEGIRADSATQITTSNNKSIQIKDVTLTRPDVSRLCTILADLIESNGSKRPEVGKAWLDAARLMLDTDNRPLNEALSLIQWSQADPFWRANILSMAKFRSKYDTLRLQRENPSHKKTTRTEENLSVVALYAAQEQTGIQA